MLPLLYIWDAQALYLGPSFDTRVHAHNAYQIIISLEGKTKVQIEDDWFENYLFIIKPNVRHKIQLLGMVAILLIDAEDSDVIKAVHESNYLPKAFDALKDCYAKSYSLMEAKNVFDDLSNDLGISKKPLRDSYDARIEKCLQYIKANLRDDLSMGTVCKANGVSESTFSHLFSKTVGLSYRRYVLWLRLKEALNLYLNLKISFTDVAVEAGFSDQAHFTNTFKDVFGIKPSYLFRNKLRILHSLNRLHIS